MKKLIDTLKSYNLPFQAIVDISGSVAAWTKYESLPQATKDSLQAIADLFDVTFTFQHVKNKLVLTGVNTTTRSNYLYTTETLKHNKLLQGKPDYLLYPNANHKLVKAE